MPIYEYGCKKCGRTLEIMQKFSDQPLTRCPSCAGRMSRLISNCTFHLKGSGWYVTDYKKKDVPWNKTGGKTKGAESDSAKKETGSGKTESASAKTEEK